LAVLFRYPDVTVYQALSETLPFFDDLATRLIGRTLVLPPRSELEVTYTALFIAAPHGVPAPPYLSCHLDEEGLVGGEVARSVRRIMASEGLKHDGRGNEPLDHLALVLELAALLAERLNDPENERSAARLDSLQHLLAGCLSPALIRFVPAVSAAAPDGFYADGALLCSFVVDALDTML
jgi:TorA maturation chaperone TorD